MNKNRNIIGELQEFFANNDASKEINSISTIISNIGLPIYSVSPKNPSLLIGKGAGIHIFAF